MKTFFLLFTFFSPLAFALNFGGLAVYEYEVGTSPALVFVAKEPISSGTTIEMFSNSQKIAVATFTSDVASGETVAIADKFFSHGTIRVVPQVVLITAPDGREICRVEDFGLSARAELSGRDTK